MVRTCIVNGCRNRYDKSKDIKFYKLPSIIQCKSEKVVELSTKRRQKWMDNIQRQDVAAGVIKFVYVCSIHFLSGK